MYNFLAYIDPGTGSMLLTVILSVVTAAVFAVRGLVIKFRVKVSGGKFKDIGKVPFVIFSDHKRYWNVFEPVCDEFEKREIECLFWTASPDDPALSKDYKYVKCEFIGEGNKCFARLNMMKAWICLSTTPGLDVLQWKRSKDTEWYAHIYHSLGDGLTYRMFALDYYDAILANGDVQYPVVRELERLRNLSEKEIYTVGSTYMDRMYKQSLNYNNEKHDGVRVLLAPSWGEVSILNKMGEKIIESLIKTGYKIIIRPHPQSKVSETEMLDRLQSKFPNSEMLEWNYDNDNFKVLSESDILISDYSEIIFDYAFIFNRPFICANSTFDSQTYDAAWIDEQPWAIRIVPKLGRRLSEDDFDNFKEIIDSTINSKEYADNIEMVKNEAWQFRGDAAIRTVDYMVNKYEELKKKVEVNE